MSVAPALDDAAAALGRQDWVTARALYARALALEETAPALEGFAVASWWLDDVGAAIDARERAYALRRASADTVEAARLAGFLAWDHGAMRGATAVANGWLQRARSLIADLPPTAEQAWLPLIEASFHLDTDANAVLRLSTEAAEHARAHGALDIEMTARTLQGLALVTLGRVTEGTRLLDEGVAAATSGELYDPVAIGSCCCNMIIACERTRDFERAGQWCERLAAFCERTGQRPLLALCRAHNGTVLTMRGEWPDAERDLEWAGGELATLRPPLAGYARARLADLRRRQGRPRQAGGLLGKGGGHVLDALVRAALAFEHEDPSSALHHADRYLRAFGEEQPIETAAALELLVPVHIQLGASRDAAARHEQLAALTHAVGTDCIQGGERAAAGSIALSARRAAEARAAFEDAVDMYERASAPFEAAHARMGLAQALAQQGKSDAALEHATAASTTLARLGATHAARRAGELVKRLGGSARPQRGGDLTTREAEVLALVAEGLSNRAIAERLVVSEHTVHRHLANIYQGLGVSSRAQAVAVAVDRGLLA
jgi:LuxR family transcriptional regulator, maltose regulon positive regulatory protein